jgi:hypothetical protein
MKCLGKRYDQTLKDSDNVRNAKKQLEKWMTIVDKSQLPGKYKAWIFQHGVLQRLLWPLLIYEMPLSAVEEVTKFLRRWLCQEVLVALGVMVQKIIVSYQSGTLLMN